MTTPFAEWLKEAKTRCKTTTFFEPDAIRVMTREDLPRALQLLEEAIETLQQIAEPVPDGEVPDPEADDEVDRWIKIATGRKKKAREFLARLESE